MGRLTGGPAAVPVRLPGGRLAVAVLVRIVAVVAADDDDVAGARAVRLALVSAGGRRRLHQLPGRDRGRRRRGGSRRELVPETRQSVKIVSKIRRRRSEKKKIERRSSDHFSKNLAIYQKLSLLEQIRKQNEKAHK